MNMYFQATLTGKEIVKNYPELKALEVWHLLEQIIKEEVPETFEPKLLFLLIDLGLVEFEVTSSSGDADEVFALLNPNF